VRERAAHKVFTRIGEVSRERIGKNTGVRSDGMRRATRGSDSFREFAGGQSGSSGRARQDRLPVLIDEALDRKRRVIDLDERGETDTWDVPAADRTSPYVAFVPIIEGLQQVLYVLHRAVFTWP
jgi:hypothetical protein